MNDSQLDAARTELWREIRNLINEYFLVADGKEQGLGIGSCEIAVDAALDNLIAVARATPSPDADVVGEVLAERARQDVQAIERGQAELLT